MPFHADLHLHSHFSRATSKNLNLEHLSRWAQLKGIRVVGTGDFVHPAWLEELRKKLEPAEEGLFRLKPEYERETQDEVPDICRAPVRFMLTVEISNIYKRLDKVRKVHNVLFAPGFEAAEKIQARLDAIGNIRSDGRPILGLDSRDLLEITLESDPLSYLIPAHIWTPWFSALGSKSGFDRMEDCFGDLSSHIFAVETGLSSDPLMNWRLSQLDPYVLVSNSDAHSAQKLGRETTLFDTDCSYPAIYRALSDPEDPGLAGTVEFFPEEGKYHYDGHRKCDTRLHPQDTIANEGLCPVCGKKVTVGVMARVEELADRPEGTKSARWRPYHSLIPLPEVIGEAKNVGPGSKTVNALFETMLEKLGNELYILMEAPIENIHAVAGTLIAEGIRRMRSGEVNIAPGYDGEFGTIRIFSPEERASLSAQTSMFGKTTKQQINKSANQQISKSMVADATPEETPPAGDTSSSTLSSEQSEILPDPAQPQSAHSPTLPLSHSSTHQENPPATFDALSHLPLNAAQRQAVAYTGGHLLIVSGPGTGKTHTLTHRIAHLAQHMPPQHILAVTFTNKAAEEMRERLMRQLGEQARQITVGTFHSVCLSFLRAWAEDAGIPASFSLATPDDLNHITRTAWPADTNAQRRNRLEHISRWKGEGRTDEPPEDVVQYNRLLRKHGLLDFDDIILETLKLLRGSDKFSRKIRTAYHRVFVDEYQDINAAQHALLREIVQDGIQITAIGDPNQAIYGFRGAEARFFKSFSDDFPDTRILYLSENYRSAPAILSASGQVIGADDTGENGTAAVPPLVATLYLEGRLSIHEASTDRAEAEWVVHQIERLIGGTSMFSQDSGRVESDATAERSFGDIAVLYRLNSQHIPLEEALQRSSMPYKISGDKPLIEQPAVLELTTLLRLSHGLNVTAGAAMRLMTTVAEGIGEKTAARIETVWQQSQVSLEHLQALPGHPRVLSEHTRTGLQQLLQTIDDITTRLNDAGVAAVLARLPSLPAWSPIQTAYPAAEESLRKLIRCARLETDTTAYLDHLMLSRAYDPFGEGSECVSLMTLHAAKGLEFPVVFIVGCEHDLLPLQYPGLESAPDEERRLFYVGMTRAKERLYFVRAKRRTLFGNTSHTYPSPFLSDIEEQLKHYEHAEQRKRRPEKPPPSAQLNMFGEEEP